MDGVPYMLEWGRVPELMFFIQNDPPNGSFKLQPFVYDYAFSHHVLVLAPVLII